MRFKSIKRDHDSVYITVIFHKITFWFGPDIIRQFPSKFNGFVRDFV